MLQRRSLNTLHTVYTPSTVIIFYVSSRSPRARRRAAGHREAAHGTHLRASDHRQAVRAHVRDAQLPAQPDERSMATDTHFRISHEPQGDGVFSLFCSILALLRGAAVSTVCRTYVEVCASWWFGSWVSYGRIYLRTNNVVNIF